MFASARACGARPVFRSEDDDPTVCMLVTAILDDLAYTSIEDGDSAAGLKLLLSDVRTDLLVTDVGLPGGIWATPRGPRPD